jgi:basic amino acid/polyamine antiporter, APA family
MVKNEKLGVFDCTMIVVSLVIGMGIFRTPANVAQHVPDNFLFFFTWIAGGLIALCGALTYAEIGSRLPVTGGIIKYFLTVIILPLLLPSTVLFLFPMQLPWQGLP